MYSRSNSENCSRVDLGLEIEGKNATFFRAVASVLPAAWSPLRLNLVGSAPAPLHSSQCTRSPPWIPRRLDRVRRAPAPLHSSQRAARHRPGYLVASTRSGAHLRRSLLADAAARVPVRRSLLVAALESLSRQTWSGSASSPVPVRSGQAYNGQSVYALDSSWAARYISGLHGDETGKPYLWPLCMC
jgi:hypothetical protein